MSISKGFFFLPFVLLLSSCLPQASLPELGTGKFTLERILLLPAQAALSNDSQQRAANQKLKNDALIFDQILSEYFGKSNNIKAAPEFHSEVLAANLTGNQTVVARQAGQLSGADAVLIFTLYRFLEREGTNYSVSRPSSVSFDYKLLHVETGEILCSGMFDESQQSFLENILTFPLDQGLKWMTAREFILYGLNKRAASCRYLSHESD